LTIPFTNTDKYVTYVENGRYGVMNADGKILVNAEYDMVSVRDNNEPLADVIITGIATGSSNPVYRVFSPDGTQIGPDYSFIDCESSFRILMPPYTAMIQYGGTVTGPREYWLLDAEGKPYHGLPYSEADIINSKFHAFRNGDSYIFTDEYELEEVYKSGADKTYFDGKYRRYVYHGDFVRTYYGLLDEKGSMLFEPIYCWIEVPFEDIILLFEGAYHGPDYTLAKLVDPSGGVYCSRYNYIAFSVLEDGRYIGVAYSSNGMEGRTAYDESGQKTPYGYWFVDCFGNPVSERYEYINTSEDIEFHLKVNDENDTFTVSTADGEKKVILAKDILLARKPGDAASVVRRGMLTNERTICETLKYRYIEISESIDDGDRNANKTLDYIYKEDQQTNERTLICKSPDHTRYFDFRFTHDKWIYLAVYSHFLKPCAIGIARIDTETDIYEVIGESGEHGLIHYKGSGYYFWRGEREDRSDAGIYRLDPGLGSSEKIADLSLPLSFNPLGYGEFTEAEGNKLFFTWGTDSEQAAFVVDVKTGIVKRI